MGGTRVHFGRRSWIEEAVGSPVPDVAATWLLAEYATATPVFVALDRQHAGALVLADRPRSGVRETLMQLRKGGIESVTMLTGDSPRLARSRPRWESAT